LYTKTCKLHHAATHCNTLRQCVAASRCRLAEAKLGCLSRVEGPNLYYFKGILFIYFNLVIPAVPSNILGCKRSQYPKIWYRVVKTHDIPYLYGRFSQKSPVVSGSFAEIDLQLQAQASYHMPRHPVPEASVYPDNLKPSCMNICIHIYMYIFDVYI